jgi:hypothetical protein
VCAAHGGDPGNEARVFPWARGACGGENPGQVINGFVTVTFLAAALFVWRAGFGRIAGLFALAGASWWLGDLVPQAALVHRGAVMQLLLAYPEGRLERPYERAAVAAAYVTGAWIEVGSDPAVTLATGAVMIACVLLRWSRSTGLARRAYAGPAIAGAALGGALVTGAIERLLDAGVDVTIVHAYEVVLIATAVGLATDMRARDTVTGVVIELGVAGDQTLSARLGRALRDPTIVVLYPLEGAYVDEQGRTVSLDRVARNRAVTRIVPDGRELAAVVHDRALLGAPSLLEAVSGALTVALGNARMQADLRAQVAAVDASRLRLATAAETARRRFGERLRATADSHLRVAEEMLTADVAAELRPLRSDMSALAEGLHPSALADVGLDRALKRLAAGAGIPVDIEARVGRLPPPIEGAAWFVCSEALANVAKHSAATHAHVTAARRGDALHIEISDDGGGGADPACGSGLRGLAERVEALGETISVADRPGGGTIVIAEIPTR